VRDAYSYLSASGHGSLAEAGIKMAKHMNTRYLFQGVSIDERTKGYIERKIESIEKLLEKTQDAQVEISLDKKGKFRVEIMIKTPRDLYRSEETSESIEGSVDLIEEELKSQIRHKKEKRTTITRRGGRSIKKKMTLDENARF